MYLSMVWARVCLGTAPITVSIFLPFLKIITVGIERIPYSVATAGDSSVFNLTAFSLPLYSSASSSTSGAIIRQGPHQGAQKSTKTGKSLFRTFSSQSPSVTASACGSALLAWTTQDLRRRAWMGWSEAAPPRRFFGAASALDCAAARADLRQEVVGDLTAYLELVVPVAERVALAESRPLLFMVLVKMKDKPFVAHRRGKRKKETPQRK
mmetsp:Transcript_34871/g.75476  ORF Transcript_34871/g.75476 Transcript_34871/m.75476 type:complete len:210 (-) Transcript_34871:144-773(-)